MAGAIAPATALHWHQDQPGAKAPGQRPTRHWRALRPRRVGRWPSAVPGPAGLQGTVARGRGKRGSRFLFPPEQAKALPPLQWQGPSPLPQRCAGIRTSRGPKPPGQRPTRPRRALRTRRAGRWPAVALAGRVPVGPWFPTGRENAVRFPLRPERHPPFAKSGAFSHEAYEGGELLSAPCRSIRTLRAAPRAPYGPARH